ncbi:MAG: galactonate dehydratase, partial [Dehalococcoidia bacterium]|nr:galactonate dehydratase [Dehalococcoidia bacterium]
MKITDLRVFQTQGGHANWTFVKLYTDSGLTGVGEASLERNDEVVVKALETFRDFLVGQDPFQIEYIWNALYKQTFKYGQLIILTALSGIEQALWDIKGKALGVPVYELLGGKLRDKARAYANAWAFQKIVTQMTAEDTPDSIAENALKMVEKGFTALKWDPFREGGQVIQRSEEEFALACVKAVREAVGPSVDILIECHGRFNMHSAIRIAHKLEPYDPFFYEEPIPPDNLDALAALQRSINLPIATGERLYTRWEFRPLFEKNAAQIIQPDICNVGGIWELRKIAAMAEAYYVSVQPHNSNGPVQTIASLHLDASIPNFVFQEFFYPYLDMYNEVLTEPIIYKDGYLEIPTSPGLGTDIREDVIRKRPPSKQPPMATWIG